MWVAEHEGPSALLVDVLSNNVRMHRAINILTESCRDTNDETLASQDLCEVDFVAWVGLDQLNGWDGVSDFDHLDGGCVEGLT